MEILKAMAISFFKKIFGIDDSEVEYRDFGMLFDTLKEQFSDLPIADVKRITAYAGIIGKISYADMEISSVEADRMQNIFETVLKLSKTSASLLVSILETHRIQLFSVEDHFYSRLVNELLSLDEKKALLEASFEVAAADGSVSKEEDVVLYDVSRSMHLSHRDFVEVKKRYAKYLDVLKNNNVLE